jgi:hypothetical protein
MLPHGKVCIVVGGTRKAVAMVVESTFVVEVESTFVAVEVVRTIVEVVGKTSLVLETEETASLKRDLSPYSPETPLLVAQAAQYSPQHSVPQSWLPIPSSPPPSPH